MNILFLITARGGSKGVPNKNIYKLGGIPLLGYKAIAALKSELCTRLIVSTDSVDIADCAKQFGAEVPFMRPEVLATDTASSMDVIQHAMDWVEKNDSIKYDALFLLEPSSPFTTGNDIIESVRLFEAKKASSVLGVYEMDVSTKFIAEIENDNRMTKHYEKISSLTKLRRQDMPKEYTMNGAVYLADWRFLKEHRSFHSLNTFAYIMPKERSIEIDTCNDLHLAEFYINSGLIDISNWEV